MCYFFFFIYYKSKTNLCSSSKEKEIKNIHCYFYPNLQYLTQALIDAHFDVGCDIREKVLCTEQIILRIFCVVCKCVNKCSLLCFASESHGPRFFNTQTLSFFLIVCLSVWNSTLSVPYWIKSWQRIGC